MHQFNRQVLEQVAKDGKTYVSLAKEMAQALLGTSKGMDESGLIRCVLMMEGTAEEISPAYRAELKEKGLSVLSYRTTGQDTNEGYDTIYLVRTRTPEDL